MIPRAKMVALAKAPPVKESYRPNKLFELRKNSARTAEFTPGMVMCAPRR